jgi:hypothetical protein
LAARSIGPDQRHESRDHLLLPKADHLLLDNIAVRPDRQGHGPGGN